MTKPGEISNNLFKPDHGKVEKKDQLGQFVPHQLHFLSR